MSVDLPTPEGPERTMRRRGVVVGAMVVRKRVFVAVFR